MVIPNIGYCKSVTMHLQLLFTAFAFTMITWFWIHIIRVELVDSSSLTLSCV